MNHDLKIWPIHFSRILDGSKTFEVRENDRYFQVGDTVVLHEWDPESQSDGLKTSKVKIPKGYTGEKAGPFRIGYIYPINKTEVVFSILPIE